MAFAGLLFFNSAGVEGADFGCVAGIDYNTFLPDSAHIVRFSSAPGSIVKAKIYLKSDSVALGANFIVRYPVDMLTPILLPGATSPELIEISAIGRAGPENPFGDDITASVRGNSFKMADSSILLIRWLGVPTGPGNGVDSIPGGSGPILRIFFAVNPGATVGDSAAITLEHIPVLDASVTPPVQIACDLTSTAQSWTVPFDTSVQVISLLQVPTLNARSGESMFIVSCCDPPGDFDNDGAFNIADITAGIARIFSGGASPACLDQADSNSDNTFNIADITFGIARIFSGGPAPICGTMGS
jgi:hypothetical protein